MLFGVFALREHALGDTVSLDFASYLGGDLGDWAIGTATDADGMLYVVGSTGSDPFFLDDDVTITSVGIFAAKIDPENSTVFWARYFGADNASLATGIAVGPAGVYVMGWTITTNFDLNFPAGLPGADTVKENGTARDPVILKLNAADGALEAATYINATGNLDLPDGIAIDAVSGRVYVSGRTDTRTADDIPFPTTDGSTVSCPANGKCNVDLFLAVFSADLTDLENCTVIGGFDIDAQVPTSTPLAVDSDGVAYIAAYTESDDFPVTDGSAASGREDGLLVVIEPLAGGGTDVQYAGFIGGSGADRAYAVALDGGSVWLGGLTESVDFPGAVGPNAGQSDAFVTKLDPSLGFTVQHTTLLGGSSGDSASGLAVDGTGSVYVAATSHSSDFPVTGDAQDGTYGGGADGVVAKLDPAGNLIYATYLGGMHDDSRTSLALASLATDPAGTARVRVSGGTGSDDFPTQSAIAGQESSSGGTEDGFVASYTFVAGPPAENCANGVDDDSDGLADCDDDDCQADADGDGVLAAPCGADCDDGDPTVPAAGEICGDGKDNDCNGLTDCEESPLCDLDPACEEPDCGEQNELCSSDDDCCSGNCRRNGRCSGGSGGGAGLADAVFLRGDANDDGVVSIVDSVFTLNYLFASGREPYCLDAADADDSGVIAVEDAVMTFAFLFASGATIPDPYPTFGTDSTFDTLDCNE